MAGMKTIKEIADAAGVSKQRAYRYIRQNHISEAHHDAGVMQFDDAAASRIISHFLGENCISDAHHDVHHDASNDTVVDTVLELLKAELEIKNEQIRELNARLAESNAALVAAQQSAQAAQLLHAGTMQRQLVSGEEAGLRPEGEGRGFFGRIFGKKNRAD